MGSDAGPARARPLRVAFFGTPAPAVPALRAFVADPDTTVVAVVTNPDRPAGRGHTLTPPPVKAAAGTLGLPVWQPGKPREILDDLTALDVDACAVVAYGSLLPVDVLAAGGAGFVNLHFSLLPAWRGAAPVTHSLLTGDTQTGVTCFVLEAGMDTGPVLLAEATPIRAGETAGELTARLAELGAPLLVTAVKGLVDGTITPVPQDHDRATYAPKIAPDDARLDWHADATALADAVRAYNPVPGAHTTYQGQRLKVHRATVVGPGQPGDGPGREPGDGPGGQPGDGPGREPGVITVGEQGPVVACGRGTLRLDEVQPAGRPRMTGVDFVNGYQPAGRRLG